MCLSQHSPETLCYLLTHSGLALCCHVPFAGTGKRKAREVETGFKDTALLGAPIGAVHTPAAAVQEDADPAVPSDKCQAPLEEEEGA